MIAPVVIATASLQLMVAGRHELLRPPRPVALAAATVPVGRRRCRVAAGTPIAALARTRLAFRLRDYGSCGSRAADSASLFVTRIGPDPNRGPRRLGLEGRPAHVEHRRGRPGGAPAFRLAAAVVLVSHGAHGCQRTLAVTPAVRSLARGARLRVTVTGYDDAGLGARVRGATVRLGGARARTGAGGVALLRAPARRGVLPRDRRGPRDGALLRARGSASGEAPGRAPRSARARRLRRRRRHADGRQAGPAARHAPTSAIAIWRAPRPRSCRKARP